MTTKELGKITFAEFGTMRDYPFLIGLHLCFKMESSGISDGGKYTVNISPECNWKDLNREESITKSVEEVSRILEDAKEIVKQFDEVTWLEEAGCTINGERYGTEDLLESNWDDGGKYQYKEEYGLLCKLDDDYTVIEKYDVCVVNDITRSGSYFTEYNFENEFRVERIIEKVIPEVVIPEHTVITIGE